MLSDRLKAKLGMKEESISAKQFNDALAEKKANWDISIPKKTVTVNPIHKDKEWKRIQ